MYPIVSLLAASVLSPFFFEVTPEVRSSYVSLGKLVEDRPMQITSARVGVDAGAFGRFGVRNWDVSSLTDRRADVHRHALYHTEFGPTWQYDIDIVEGWRLKNDLTRSWTMYRGFESEASNRTYHWYQLDQSLENPYITPYWDTLTLIEPSQWTRLRFGVRRDFDLTETLTLSAWADGVWGCKRRFAARYGDEPYHQFLGGAFCTSIVGLQLSWRFAEGWCVYAKVRQFDTINQQARRAEKRKSAYYARRDIAIGTIGVAYEF